MTRVFLILLSVAFLFAGCNRANLSYDKPYFDFDSLVNEQVYRLVQEKALIQKHARVNGKSDDSSYTPDSLHLANELDVFRQLDVVNKPIYRTSYKITDGEKDTKSNLLIRTYLFSAKGPNDKSPVPYIRFYYKQSPLNPKRIESVYLEENSLYATRRELLLEFDDITGTSLLSSYKMEGIQKLIANDTTHFNIEVSFSHGLK